MMQINRLGFLYSVVVRGGEKIENSHMEKCTIANI